MTHERVPIPAAHLSEPYPPIQAGEALAHIRPVTLPPEAEIILSEYQQEKGLSNEQLAELIPRWYPNPALHPHAKRLIPRELHSRQIDAYTTIEPLLGRPEFDGTLRTMDVANGCGRQCNTCLIDAVLPSNILSLESLDRLFSSQDFLRVLQPDSFRIGSAGDIVDHPHAVEVAQMILEKTQALDDRRLAVEGKHHVVKIFTNYRKNNEKELFGLLQLAEQSNDRLDITISLPNNLVETVNKNFMNFAAANADLLQLEPFKPVNIDRHISAFIHQHPDILTSGPSQNIPQEIVDYLQRVIQKYDLVDFHTNMPYQREWLEMTVHNHLNTLPYVIEEYGTAEKYQAHLASMAKIDADRQAFDPGVIHNPHVNLQNVRVGMPLSTVGRIVTDAVLIERGQMLPGHEDERLLQRIDFRDRGLCKTFFNPDGLWIHVYATAVESHTARVYAPITPNNLGVLSRFGYNPDFPTPPNWPGGTGTRKIDVEDELEQTRGRYAELKARTKIIG